MTSFVHTDQGFQEQVGWELVLAHFLLRTSFSKAKGPHPQAAVTSMSGQALKPEGRLTSKPISDKSSTPKPDTSRGQGVQSWDGDKGPTPVFTLGD